MKITYCEARLPNRAPWRLYHRGRDRWFWSQEDADKAAADLKKNVGKLRARLTARDVDEVLHCRELLKGIPLLRAVRFYLDVHRGQLGAAQADCAVLIDRFTNELRGRPKYLAEAKRNLELLAESIGKLKPAAVDVNRVDDFLAQFNSDWSHDAALKFARAFFKWLCSPRVRVRRDNPTDTFEFKRPSGTKVYLSLPDVEHVMKTCQSHFPEIIGAVALQLFAGVRTEEIIRATWSMVRRGMIRLEPEVAKMGQVKGKKVPRIIDFWPTALDAWMPKPLPSNGPLIPDIERKKNAKGLHHRYRDLKSSLIAKCQQTKPDFRWGQNAFRHSYGTYGYAFWQSSDKIAKLMGERDVDTVHNHYAEYETEENGQKFFSIGSAELEPLPMPKNALAIIQKLMAGTEPKPAIAAQSA